MFNLKRVTSAAIAVSLTFALAFPVFASSYTVRPGDSLFKVGELFNTSTGNIMSTNNLLKNVIYPGQKLIVPADTYWVKSGDSLYFIAKRHSIALTDLKEINNLTVDKIYPGQKLILPKASAAIFSSATVTMNAAVAPVSGSGVNYTSADVDLLARLITAEAEGESYKAKVGVGAVVVNRVQDERFPKTISGVINQKDDRFYQFTPVENGFIKKSASLSSINAAKEALKGSDPTNGAVYYFDDSATNTWLWSKPIAIRIGSMVYTY